jgi:hypothetical protein
MRKKKAEEEERKRRQTRLDRREDFGYIIKQAIYCY